jgi:hypothetical protein
VEKIVQHNFFFGDIKLMVTHYIPQDFWSNPWQLQYKQERPEALARLDAERFLQTMQGLNQEIREVGPTDTVSKVVTITYFVLMFGCMVGIFVCIATSEDIARLVFLWLEVAVVLAYFVWVMVYHYKVRGPRIS